jgi:hypothetical protein
VTPAERLDLEHDVVGTLARLGEEIGRRKLRIEAAPEALRQLAEGIDRALGVAVDLGGGIGGVTPEGWER